MSASLGIVLDEKMLERFDAYAAYLKEYNEKVNLTAITGYEEVLDKHFYDCLLGVNGVLKGSLADVGSGAGFPGVVYKIVFPELQVSLIEPLKKRCVFLESLIERLGLEGIEVINERAEDYALKHRECYDYVTARAVTNLSALLELCVALIKVNGCFIALRGKDGHLELEQARNAMKKLSLNVENVYDRQLFQGDSRVIAYLRKSAQTSLKYPRKYNIIKRNPL